MIATDNIRGFVYCEVYDFLKSIGMENDEDAWVMCEFMTKNILQSVIINHGWYPIFKSELLELINEFLQGEVK